MIKTCKTCKHSFIGDLGLAIHNAKKHNKKKGTVLRSGKGSQKVVKKPKELKKEKPQKQKGIKNLKAQVKTCYRYKCVHCGRSFSKIKRLRDHTEKLHPVLNAFLCDVCGGYFLNNDILEDHRKIHNGYNQEVSTASEPFFTDGAVNRFSPGVSITICPCDICGLYFASLRSMEAHQRKHHEDPERNRIQQTIPDTGISRNNLRDAAIEYVSQYSPFVDHSMEENYSENASNTERSETDDECSFICSISKNVQTTAASQSKMAFDYKIQNLKIFSASASYLDEERQIEEIHLSSGDENDSVSVIYENEMISCIGAPSQKLSTESSAAGSSSTDVTSSSENAVGGLSAEDIFKTLFELQEHLQLNV